MDNIQIATLVAGALVPFFISLIKRWVVLEKGQVSLLTFTICFVTAVVIYLIESDMNFGALVGNIAEVYATSQVVYWAVLKTLNLDTRIEGEETDNQPKE